MEDIDQIVKMLGKDQETINKVKQVLKNPSAVNEMKKMMNKTMGVKNEPKQVNKIGRNEQCPCHSVKKYKKCCYNTD